MSQWLEGRVAARRDWTDSLHSLEVEAPELTFVAGQFARLALPAPPGEKDPMLGRPYSFVNPPHAPRHEFYFNVVPGGPLSPRLAALEAGDPIWLGARANGFFSVPEVPQAEALWCLATGTGIGPFLSILRTRGCLGEVRPHRARARGAARLGAATTPTRSPASRASARARSRSCPS